MIVEVRINSFKLVAPKLDDVYDISFVAIGKDAEIILNDANVELRRQLINEYGDGTKIYLLMPESASATHIVVSEIDSQPSYRPHKKSTTRSSSDVRILYKKEV